MKKYFTFFYLRNQNIIAMFKRTIINTFVSEADCDMFIMVLRQQWPSFLKDFDGVSLEICKDINFPNRMLALWTLSEKTQLEKIENLGAEIIIPYRDRLSPKTSTYDFQVHNEI